MLLVLMCIAQMNGTLMHHAAASGNLAVVKWLQSLGLDAGAVGGEQQLLPLHWACQFKHLHIVKQKKKKLASFTWCCW
jgi:ankyrin repeat protein